MESDATESQLIEVEKKAGFIARLFRGEVSLPITYWVFGVLIGNVCTLISLTIIGSYEDIASYQIGAWVVMGFYWVVVAYIIFIYIAIWRSAGNYQGMAIWAGLARVVVVLSALVLIANFIVWFQQGSDKDLALNEEIKMFNLSLPSMADDDTRLDHVSIQDKDIYYNYTLVNMLAADLDLTRFTLLMTPNLKTAQCANEEARPLLNEGRKLVYMYRDKSSKAVAKIVVEKSDCL